MLPLISSLATESGGFSDESSGNLPVSAAPGREFAGLLKGSVAGQAQVPGPLPAGHALPPGGKPLPAADLEMRENPLLELELSLTGFFEQSLEPIGTTESGSILYGLGLTPQPATVELDGAHHELSIEQSANGLLPLGNLTSLESGRLGELIAQPGSTTPLAEFAAAAVAPAPAGLVAGQRLVDPAGALRADNLLPGTPAAANQNPEPAEMLTRVVAAEQRIAASPPVVEQSLLNATRLAPESGVMTESSRIAAEFLKAAADRQSGGPTTGAAATTTVSAAGGLTATSALPLNLSSPPPLLPQTPLPTLNIGTPLQDPAWSQALGNRVLVMSGQQLQSAEIRISPAELGPITVNLSIDDGSADLTFVAHHALTRDAIEQALPRLREMLSENGLSLGNATVSDDGVSKEGFGQASGGGNGGEALAETGAAFDEPEQIVHARIAQGLIDTFV
jgi:hypothetical protein